MTFRFALGFLSLVCVCGQWITTGISTPRFENQCSIDFLDSVFERLRGRHLLFIGDSTTRYMYLAAAHFLVHKRFPPHIRDGMQPSVANEQTFPTWSEFYRVTNEMFLGAEFCDCYRTPQSSLENILENRYLHIESHNITMTYLQLFGRFNMTASVTAGFRKIVLPNAERHLTINAPFHRALPLFFRDLPLADYVIANSGIHHDLSASNDTAYFESLLTAVETTTNPGAALVWRSTAVSNTFNPQMRYDDIAVTQVLRRRHPRWLVLHYQQVLASIDHKLAFWDNGRHVQAFVNEEILRIYFSWLINSSCLSLVLNYVS